MFIGIDHGTTAIRFASATAEFKMSRSDARTFTIHDLERLCPLEKIEGIALCYSMGDNFTEVTDITRLTNRGVVTRDGAGEHVGGGTRVFDEVFQSGIPAVAVPGIHRGSKTDPRFKVYSHQASPEKIGIAYLVSKHLGDTFIVSDVSSNTVTLLVQKGLITGAFDACIFAPGTRHGALDVDAIRRVDDGLESANEAFMHAGVSDNLPEEYRVSAVAMFAAMEIAGLLLLAPDAPVALAGSSAPAVAEEVRGLLRRDTIVFDEWSASRGLSMIAEDIASGTTEILGIPVDN
ncbi:MAG: methanogenesis marker 12 protein [Methanocalculus sp. MSAO_Arc1]|uniref:methanogenesis marker 12 protein n=1 Tax=Methanocalculus TaxID=71151 RepID=UPI000FF2158B|nr:MULTISPECIES: methanogenesis marker 12 protein [unclassified Methanocalculus]RQD81765.1 MAG: methanogenesis marker 12 protein [Methanocalculus sp. MSAO_Arc1]